MTNSTVKHSLIFLYLVKSVLVFYESKACILPDQLNYENIRVQPEFL